MTSFPDTFDLRVVATSIMMVCPSPGFLVGGNFVDWFFDWVGGFGRVLCIYVL